MSKNINDYQESFYCPRSEQIISEDICEARQKYDNCSCKEDELFPKGKKKSLIETNPYLKNKKKYKKMLKRNVESSTNIEKIRSDKKC